MNEKEYNKRIKICIFLLVVLLGLLYFINNELYSTNLNKNISSRIKPIPIQGFNKFCLSNDSPDCNVNFYQEKQALTEQINKRHKEHKEYCESIGGEVFAVHEYYSRLVIFDYYFCDFLNGEIIERYSIVEYKNSFKLLKKGETK